MPLAWRNGHLLWRNGHLAWSPDCCCAPSSIECNVCPGGTAPRFGTLAITGTITNNAGTNCGAFNGQSYELENDGTLGQCAWWKDVALSIQPGDTTVRLVVTLVHPIGYPTKIRASCQGTSLPSGLSCLNMVDEFAFDPDNLPEVCGTHSLLGDGANLCNDVNQPATFTL